MRACRIVGFSLDARGKWVAELDCGHAQHVRHDPPLESRPWVATDAGRAEHLGTILQCPTCRDPVKPDHPGEEQVPERL